MITDFLIKMYVQMIITGGQCTNNIGCIRCEKNMKKVCSYKHYKCMNDVLRARIYFAVRRLEETKNIGNLFEEIL